MTWRATAETFLFNKSNELYGLFEASRNIRDKNYAIIVEGYMDVIALSQFGIDNAIAVKYIQNYKIPEKVDFIWNYIDYNS